MQRSKKKTSPVFWLALIGLGAAAFVLTSPPDEAKKTTVRKPVTRKADVVTLITKEDLTAKFDPVNITAKNAFMPYVKKSTGDSAQAAPNALPSVLTNGESGWVYTGTAEVDGRIQAVVENQASGQGDFLSVGQNWKNARVVAVTESKLVLEGKDGQQVTVMMQEKLGSNSMVAGGFAPVNINPSGLRGPIGPVVIQPQSGAPTNSVTSESEGNAS
jgi:hypothetical protein